MKPFPAFIFLGFIVLWPQVSHAYPMNGYAHTGIGRLEALKLIHEKKMTGPRRVVGARLGLDQVDIKLAGHTQIDIPAPDPEFTQQVQNLLGDDAPQYNVAVLDLTDTNKPMYAAINEDALANPGSVGKLVVSLALFQALADLYPDDIEKRLHILRSTMVVADDFILSDHHKAPFWSPGMPAIQYRPIHQGDQASLFTFVDWMMSASSNAAAAMVQREIMLINRFKHEYPVSEHIAASFFKDTPRKERAELFVKSFHEPLIHNGMDINGFRQGSFFTWNGKKKVAGTTSYASPRALIQFLLKLEKGHLVDEFSSREIKRLLYMTGKRIRYASSPALYNSAVYFKSGSLYKCKPEPDFKCRKYQGNMLNQLSSVAIVEHPAKDTTLHYMVAVMSNVLYKNSAVAHQTLATGLHRLIENRHMKKPVKRSTVTE